MPRSGRLFAAQEVIAQGQGIIVELLSGTFVFHLVAGAGPGVDLEQRSAKPVQSAENVSGDRVAVEWLARIQPLRPTPQVLKVVVHIVDELVTKVTPVIGQKPIALRIGSYLD